VRWRIASKNSARTGSASSTAAVSATTPGVTALARTGAILRARELTSPRIAELAMDNVVKPGAGRYIDSPLNVITEPSDENLGRATADCGGVADGIHEHGPAGVGRPELDGGVEVAVDRGEDRVVADIGVGEQPLKGPRVRKVAADSPRGAAQLRGVLGGRRWIPPGDGRVRSYRRSRLGGLHAVADKCRGDIWPPADAQRSPLDTPKFSACCSDHLPGPVHPRQAAWTP
jgi:hypothetical protein